MALVLLLILCFLAGSNGANDNFKGVASLFGSRTTSYRTAISWATVTTFAGSLTAMELAQGLLGRFTGKGLVPDGLAGSPAFLLAVALGAGATVALATAAGFPISTTHALTGAMVGAGCVAVGAEVRFSVLGRGFFMPLLMSPVLGVGLAATIHASSRALGGRFGLGKDACLCAGEEAACAPVLQPSGEFALQPAAPPISVSVDSRDRCETRYAGVFLGVDCRRLVDAGHFLSAGVVSFARGLNDTPKMAALLLVLPPFGARGALVLVALGIAVGGLVGARRVAETMSHKITRLDAGQGFSANLATGLLVLLASLYGLPVSTTHVSVGALLGVGLTTGEADFRVIRKILLSWLITLPCGALIGAMAYACLHS